MKTILIVIPQRCWALSVGYGTQELYSYSMLAEALAHYDRVIVTGLYEGRSTEQNLRRIDGERVEFRSMKTSRGVLGALISAPSRLGTIWRESKGCCAIVLHAPSDLAVLGAFVAVLRKIPFGLDVRGDQSVSTKYLKARGTVGARFIAGAFAFLFTLYRRRAKSAVYVSRELMLRFPVLRHGSEMIVASDLRIGSDWFMQPRPRRAASRARLIFVGRLEAQKNLTLLISTLSMIEEKIPGLWELRLVGAGPMLLELKAQASKAGIESLITFVGHVPWGSELKKEFANSEIFVLPSITEGMSRSLLEAMAAGLSVIASNVGGASEAVPAEGLFNVDSPEELEFKLTSLLEDENRRFEHAQNCFNASKAYLPDALIREKQRFYKSITT